MSARALVERLAASPREAGTPAAVAARESVAGFLRGLGYEVREQPFAFPPSSLTAFPVLGAGLGWLTLLLVPLLLLPAVPAWAALTAWLAGAAALLMLAWGIGTGIEIPGAERRTDANLIAIRGPAVRRWLVAHLDTKAQGHSMAGRLAAVWVLLLAAAALTVLTALRALAPAPLPGWAVMGASGLSLAAGYLASRGRLRGGSPGARDNATGLLALLTAAERLRDPAIGLVVTGAEEFGLVGGRVFARDGALRGTEVINLDTLADRGPLYLIAHDSAGLVWARALAPAFGRLGLEVVVRRLALGILVDSLPLARAGARAVTLARLDWSVLRLIHTSEDRLEGLDLATAERVGVLIAGPPPHVDPMGTAT